MKSIFLVIKNTRVRGGGGYGPGGGGLVQELLLSGANQCTSRKSRGLGTAYTSKDLNN